MTELWYSGLFVTSSSNHAGGIKASAISTLGNSTSAMTSGAKGGAKTSSSMESAGSMAGTKFFWNCGFSIRAAFKAVQESKQVVYLVPTTILAQQHYNTFLQRAPLALSVVA